MEIRRKWYRSHKVVLSRQSVHMYSLHDVPSRAANATRQLLERTGISNSGKKFMMWFTESPDLNPIENLWAIVKKKIYVGGRHAV